MPAGPWTAVLGRSMVASASKANAIVAAWRLPMGWSASGIKASKSKMNCVIFPVSPPSAWLQPSAKATHLHVEHRLID